jgi:hypothetical protein
MQCRYNLRSVVGHVNILIWKFDLKKTLFRKFRGDTKILTNIQIDREFGNLTDWKILLR